MPFKPSTHRKCFIDQKIRENTYPTAASLARDYLTEYGIHIDPRTIAYDIADMRRELQAPIRYDSEKRGYIYTDPAFNANLFEDSANDIPLGSVGLAGLTALGLKPQILPLIPSSVFLSDWHRGLLQSVAENIGPPLREKGRNLGKISIVQQPQAPSAAKEVMETTLMDALEHNRELSVSYAATEDTATDYLLRPLHLVYLKNEESGALNPLILAAVPASDSIPYVLLYTARIQKAQPSGTIFSPVKSLYIQPINNQGIEFLLSYDHLDTILVFADKNAAAQAAEKEPDKNCPEYALLSRMDIYTAPFR